MRCVGVERMCMNEQVHYMGKLLSAWWESKDYSKLKASSFSFHLHSLLLFQGGPIPCGPIPCGP